MYTLLITKAYYIILKDNIQYLKININNDIEKIKKMFDIVMVEYESNI